MTRQEGKKKNTESVSTVFVWETLWDEWGSAA